jgi:hypothetical protein
MTSQTKASKIHSIALALALSCGTAGGMLAFATLTEPAMARGQGGGDSGNGGEPGGVMAADREPVTHAQNQRERRRAPETCDAQSDGASLRQCKFTPPPATRPTARLVKINGFANCAVVQQVPVGPGQQPEFYCLKGM